MYILLQWHHQLIRLADEKVNFSCEVVVILYLQENIGCGYTLEVFPRDAKKFARKQSFPLTCDKKIAGFQLNQGVCYLLFVLYWVILHAFLSSADFFQNQLFQKILSGIPSECQTVWIPIRPDVLSGSIWVKTVCKGNQQTTLAGKALF